MNAVYYFFEREMTRWLRARIAVVSTLMLPAAWLIFVGLALPIRFTDNYVDFLTPGIVIMTVFNASMAGGSLLLYDNILGFLNKFLALPAPHESILFGKIMFITTRGLIQAMIILIISALIGGSILDPARYLAILAILILIGVLFSSIATTIALMIGEYDSYGAVNALISMPLFFTSSALMPYYVMPDWLRIIAHLNPLSFAIDSVRSIATGIIPYSQIAIMGCLCGGVLGCCVVVFRKFTTRL
ncbi:ABC transporter permease [uncultured Methanospirillum sp.]|uniref:ABC transporter permease n=1 Tax=uncultured Methanospirillum sp. TaxID=262503 RepID=UPI0029C8F10A|nr:ABC transporter permease [uncultured Methanospirillum sp.]